MPTMDELREAAKRLASKIGPDCAPAYLLWVARDAARRPEDWGYPRSYARRPNWGADLLREEISRVLWGLPTHPARVPAAYRHLPYRLLARIASGHIEDTWWDAPSRRVRHEYLVALSIARRHRAPQWREWADNPLRWYTRHCPIGGYVPRSWILAEWLIAKRDWAGWNRPMAIGYGPDGRMVAVHPQDILDEVWEADIIGDEAYQASISCGYGYNPQIAAAARRPSPERVFRRALARRSSSELERIARENAPLPEMPWSEIPGVVQLRTARELVEEGRRMEHCVGGYAESARRGDCYILRLPHSTAEVRPDGSVYQHRGRANQDPPAGDKALLARWLAKRARITTTHPTHPTTTHEAA